MGEYALYEGREIKIGTCENMYYLRFDQRHQVQHLPGNVDVQNPEHVKELRFRFPFPDEDHTAPGSFESYGRHFAVHGVTLPEEIEHGSVQFTSAAGYLTSLPCPESKEGRALPFKVHRNGWRGDLLVVQQRVWEDRLVLVAECGGCDSKFRLPTIKDAEPVILYCLDKAERLRVGGELAEAGWWKEVGARIIEGYKGVKL